MNKEKLEQTIAWDSVWNNINNSFILRIHRKVCNKVIFYLYKRFLDYVNLKNPDIIELGCGSGELSAKLLKRYGGSVTLVDNSENALNLAKSNYRSKNLKACFLKKDLFCFHSKKKYDLVHSEGLIEHFIGAKQRKIINIHKDLAKKNGYILISVPRETWYYKIFRKFLEKRKWIFGFEKPLDEKELKDLLEKSGLNVIKSKNSWACSLVLAKI